MRTFTSAMTDFLANNPRNVEPVLIVSIDWSGEGHEFLYADRVVEGIPGKILSVGSIESLLSSKTGTNFAFQYTLSDTDGVVKGLLDRYDPYGKRVKVYQYFNDSSLSLSDKFLIFTGVIQYDVSWSERDRAVTISVISEVEQREVGFSPEEGQFDFVSKDAVGKPWPLCYGTPLHVPATKITSINTATLNDQILFVDPVLYYKRKILYLAILQNYAMDKYYQNVALSTHAVQNYTAQGLLQALLALLKERAEDTEDYNLLLAELTLKKNLLKQAIRGRIPDNPAALRQDIDDLQDDKRDLEDDIVGPIQGDIEQIVAIIPILEASIEQRSNSLDKQYEAISAISVLYQEYLQLDFEIARLERQVKTTVHVKDAENFPQNTPVDVLINNMRFRGIFADDMFTIQQMIPKYSNIVLAPRESLPSDHRYDEAYATFWVADERIRLEGLYIYVHSNRTGHKHIVKVIEQKGRQCTIELANHSGQTQSDLINERVNRSSPFVPVATRNTEVQIYQNFFPIGNFGQGIMDQYINILTSPEYMTSLGQLPLDVTTYIDNYIGRSNINESTFQLLLKLSKIRERDNQLYIVNINGDLLPTRAFTITTYDFDTILAASPVVLESWLTPGILVDEIPQSNEWNADQGTVIIDATSSCQIYVANIIASDIKSVSAYRVVEGYRSLVSVPSHLYTYQNETLGPMTLSTVRLRLPLASLNDGWEDQIYVTVESSVGPNVVDVIADLITRYTTKAIDSASFAEVHTAVANYPVNFALLSKKNVFEQINEIAYLARCVVYLRDDTFFIKYLSVKPDSVLTLGEDTVEFGTMLVSYSDLTDITTRLTATWIPDYSGEDEPYRIVLRNNMPKYGLHAKEQFYYIYNSAELVQKSATFHLIRDSGSWKQLQVTCPLKNLKLEAFDAVALDLPHVAEVLALVTNLDYDLGANVLRLNLWLPVRAGSQEEYPFAWPGSVEDDVEYVDNPGTGGVEVTGTLPECTL